MTTTTTTTTESTTKTLEVPGATLTYDLSRNAASAEAPLFLIGSPMGASGFQTLASYFGDRTVVRYDPRGVDRSTKADPTSESTPEQHADDLRRVIGAVALGPVDLFATSGGAVNALALVERHPEAVRVLVAHEPPAARLIPDGDAAIAATTDIAETYLRAGFGPAMAKFILVVSHKGPLPADLFDGPDPDPAMFGLPTADDGGRTDPLLRQNIKTSIREPIDIEALRSSSTRIVVGVGEELEGQLARRAGEALAERLGIEPIVFPGGHAGFLGNEYGPGQAGKPEAFAARLREVLATRSRG